MKKAVLSLLAAAAMVAGSVGVAADRVSAIPVPSFTETATPLVVGQTVTFDGTTSRCDTPSGACVISWQLTWRSPGCCGATHTIATFTNRPIIAYTPSLADASHPYISVTMTAGNGNSTNNFRTSSKSYVVQLTPPPPG